MSKKALITGCKGFVGRHFSMALSRDDWSVTGVDVTFPELGHMGGRGMVNFIDDAYDEYFDLVVHAAAAGPNRKAIDTQAANFPYNVSLDATLFHWVMRMKTPPRVVYFSSSAVYSPANESGYLHGSLPYVEREGTIAEPFDSYGLTKRFGERMAEAAHDAGVPVTVVRPFSGYGEDQSEDFPFRAFVERAKRRENPFVIWGNMHQIRDFIHIDDIVAGTLALVEAEVRRPVNLCTGVGTTMFELAQRVTTHAGGWATYRPTFHVDENAPLGVMYRVGDPTLLRQYYEPKITIEEGVRRAFA